MSKHINLFFLIFSLCITQCTTPSSDETVAGGDGTPVDVPKPMDDLKTDCNSKRETVPETDVVPREGLWLTYSQEGKMPNDWKVNLPNNTDYYTMQKSTIVDLVKMTQVKGDEQIDVDLGFWLMMALVPGKESSSETSNTYDTDLYLYCYTVNNDLRVFQPFNTKDGVLQQVDVRKAQEQIATAQQFTEAYNKLNSAVPSIDDSNISVFPYGFKFPLCDLIEIADDLQDEKSLEAVFVIKPEIENTEVAAAASYRPDIYLKVDKDNPPTSSLYYDFTTPCPTICPSDTAFAVINYE